VQYRSVRKERGLARLVAFSDAVVAIAITLLVLPLVISATELDTDVGSFLVANGFQLQVLVITFLVIGRFWLVHHRMYENLIDYNSQLQWANMLWLFTIVLLSLPTELLSGPDRDDPIKYALYIGTMTLTCLAAMLQQSIIVRHPQLQDAEVRGTLRLLPYLSTTAIMVVALVVAVIFPVVGLWAVLLLFLSAPVDRAIGRRIRKDS